MVVINCSSGAFLDDKDYVTPEHVLSIVEDVLIQNSFHMKQL